MKSAVQPEHLYQLAYCSVVRAPMTLQTLEQIVSRAQAHNQQHGITGILMADSGLFVQWLEGPQQAVRELWARILEDKRHHCIVQLLEQERFTSRLFETWSMRLTSRQELIEIVHGAKEASMLSDNPWAPAIATLCILLDEQYSQAYGRVALERATALPLQAVVETPNA